MSCTLLRPLINSSSALNTADAEDKYEGSRSWQSFWARVSCTYFSLFHSPSLICIQKRQKGILSEFRWLSLSKRELALEFYRSRSVSWLPLLFLSCVLIPEYKIFECWHRLVFLSFYIFFYAYSLLSSSLYNAIVGNWFSNYPSFANLLRFTILFM